MATPPQFPGGFGPEQMQQMQVLMSMMAGGGGGFPTMPPPMPQAFGTGLPSPPMPGMDPAMAQAFGTGLHSPPMPGMDPAMAQAYAQVLQQYMQGLGQPNPGFPGAPGALPPPYGGMPQPAALPLEPTVSVSVEGMKFQYQLTEDDLHKVFKRYGAVKRVNVDEACSSATVTFHTQQDAQAAINDLDGKVLNGLEGTLRISWVSQGAAAAPVAPYASMGFPGIAPGALGFPQANASWTPPVPGAPVLPSTLGGAGGSPGGHGACGEVKPPHVKGAKKYTCRFLIGIENDKEFQVARRLIGSKGANMKRIVRVTEAKLRLRGQGSGYFEGAGQKESSEPLQLCVSCTSQEGYKTAVRQVEELLTRVYEEYRQFCRENNMPVPEDLRINFSENQLVYSRLGGAGGCGGALGDGDASGGGGGSGGRSPKRGGGGRGGGKKGGAPGAGGARGAGGGQGDPGEPGPNAPPVDEIQGLISERNEARRACNFAEADRIRELLHSRGVALMDEPGGRGKGTEVTTWRYWRD